MVNHTPGPWFVDQQGAPTVRKADGSVICGVPSNYSDARLIAEAPAMLAALKFCVFALDSAVILQGMKELAPYAEQARAVIVKIEGEV